MAWAQTGGPCQQFGVVSGWMPSPRRVTSTHVCRVLAVSCPALGLPQHSPTWLTLTVALGGENNEYPILQMRELRHVEAKEFAQSPSLVAFLCNPRGSGRVKLLLNVNLRPLLNVKMLKNFPYSLGRCRQEA